MAQNSVKNKSKWRSNDAERRTKMYKPYFLEKRKIARAQCEDRSDSAVEQERDTNDGKETEDKEEAE